MDHKTANNDSTMVMLESYRKMDDLQYEANRQSNVADVEDPAFLNTIFLQPLKLMPPFTSHDEVSFRERTPTKLQIGK